MECPVCGSEDIVAGSWNQPGQHFCRSCGSFFYEAVGVDNGDTEPIRPIHEEPEAVVVYDCPTCGQSCAVQPEGLTCPNGHVFTIDELIRDVRTKRTA